MAVRLRGNLRLNGHELDSSYCNSYLSLETVIAHNWLNLIKKHMVEKIYVQLGVGLLKE